MNKIILGVIVWLSFICLVTLVTPAHSQEQAPEQFNQEQFNSDVAVVVTKHDAAIKAHSKDIKNMELVIERYRESLVILYKELDQANKKIDHLLKVLSNVSL